MAGAVTRGRLLTWWLAALSLVTITACSSSGSSNNVSPPSTPAPVASSAAATPSATPTAPRPAGTATDVSFISSRHGWLLGGNLLETTTDGGLTWSVLPKPPSGVRQLRFANATVGYAWTDGSSLWQTTDGGRSWHNGGLQQVRSLESAAGHVWALAGEIPYPNVVRSNVGFTRWTKLGRTPNRSGTLDVHGSIAYVVGNQGAGPIEASIDIWTGTSRRNQKLPCAGHQYVPEAPLGVSTDGSLFLVCNISNGDQQTQRAYVSKDEARTWTAAAAPSVAPDDVTAVAGRRFAWQRDLYVDVNGRWSLSLHGPGGPPDNGPGFYEVGFQDDVHGVALTGAGALYFTRDAGRTWRRSTY
jgi:hypothetical protein